MACSGCTSGNPCGNCGPNIPAGTDPCQTPGCVPGPGNEPTTGYGCSLGVQLQGTVDEARRLVEELGLSPYNVTLVWQERDRRQEFQVLKRIQLVPVSITPDGGEWSLGASGARQDGGIILTEVSPNLVTESDLRGRIDGKDPPDGIEFFYDVRRSQRCPNDKIIPGRYTIAAVPFLDAMNFQWVIRLTTQEAPRSDDDRDQVHEPARGPRGGTSLRM